MLSEPPPLPVQFLQGGAPRWLLCNLVRMLGSEGLPLKAWKEGEKVENVNYNSTWTAGSSSWHGLKAIWIFSLMGKEKLLVTTTSQCSTLVGISQFHLPNFSQLSEAGQQ